MLMKPFLFVESLMSFTEFLFLKYLFLILLLLLFLFLFLNYLFLFLFLLQTNEVRNKQALKQNICKQTDYKNGV